jgi:hypothetical protein
MSRYISSSHGTAHRPIHQQQYLWLWFLEEPVNDSKNMAAMLRKLVFSVTMKEKAIAVFGNWLKRSTAALLK